MYFFHFLFPVVIFYIMAQQDIAHRIYRFQTFCNRREQGNNTGYLCNNAGEVSLIHNDFTYRNLTLRRQITCKSQTQHLKYLKCHPADRREIRLDNIQLQSTLGDILQLFLHTHGFCALQCMCPGDRNQFHHFHDTHGGFFHVLTELSVMQLDLILKYHHDDDCNRNC